MNMKQKKSKNWTKDKIELQHMRTNTSYLTTYYYDLTWLCPKLFVITILQQGIFHLNAENDIAYKANKQTNKKE